MKINMKPALDLAEKCGKNICGAAKSLHSRIDEQYTEYDIDIKKTSHLTPSQVDENGNEENVVTETCQTKLKIKLRDVITALYAIALVCTLIHIIKKNCNNK